MLSEQFGFGQVDRVDPVEAGAAESILADSGGLDQLLEVDVPQRVGADRVADLLGGQAVGDELRTAGEVDAVEAGPFDGRARDANVRTSIFRDLSL